MGAENGYYYCVWNLELVIQLNFGICFETITKMQLINKFPLHFDLIPTKHLLAITEKFRTLSN